MASVIKVIITYRPNTECQLLQQKGNISRNEIICPGISNDLNREMKVTA